MDKVQMVEVFRWLKMSRIRIVNLRTQNQNCDDNVLAWRLRLAEALETRVLLVQKKIDDREKFFDIASAVRTFNFSEPHP